MRVLRRILSLFRKPDYRLHGYAHRDLSEQTRLPWHARLRLMLSTRGGMDHADDRPGFWVENRRWLLAVIGLLLAWVIYDSVVAWNFFDG